MAATEKRTGVEIALAEAKLRAEARKESVLADIAELDYRKKLREIEGEEASNEHNRVYDFVDAVTSTSVNSCIKTLSRWRRQSRDPITVIINSPGGEVIHGLRLYDYLLFLRAEDIHITTVTLGMAASMASVLLQAGDQRIVGPNAHVLIHEVSSGAMGKIGELEDEFLFCRALNTRLFNILASRSTLSFDEISERAKRRDWWLDAEATLSGGFADEIGYA